MLLLIRIQSVKDAIFVNVMGLIYNFTWLQNASKSTLGQVPISTGGHAPVGTEATEQLQEESTHNYVPCHFDWRMPRGGAPPPSAKVPSGGEVPGRSQIVPIIPRRLQSGVKPRGPTSTVGIARWMEPDYRSTTNKTQYRGRASPRSLGGLLTGLSQLPGGRGGGGNGQLMWEQMALVVAP